MSDFIKRLGREMKGHEEEYRGFLIDKLDYPYTWAAPDFDGAPIDHETPTSDPHGSGSMKDCREAIDLHLAELADEKVAKMATYFEKVPQLYKDSLNVYFEQTNAKDFQREHLECLVGMIYSAGIMAALK